MQTVLKKLNIALFAAATAAVLAAPAHAVVITTTPVTPINITNSIDGIYFNVITGVSGASGAAVPGWDINPYNNGGGFTLYGAASPSGILATGVAGTLAVAQLLAPGSVVSPTPAVGFYNQFQTTAPGFQTPGNHYFGFKFLNETTGAANYGYMLINNGAGTGTALGFPASIVSYAYENTGLAITIPSPVPEASTYAMMGLGLAAIAGLTARRRRAA